MNLHFPYRRHFLATSLLAALALAACSDDSSSSTSGPPCTGKGEGSACENAEACKPAACKCVDGTGSDTATNRVCVNKVCSAKSLCDSQCKDNGGVANSATCS